MDSPSIFEQPASTPASRPVTKPRATPTKKVAVVPTAIELNSQQARAIRFLAFDQDNVPQNQTVGEYSAQFTNQFLTEAVAYLLGRKVRQGAELPPRILAELTEQQLVK